MRRWFVLCSLLAAVCLSTAVGYRIRTGLRADEAPRRAAKNRLAKETSPYLLLHADNPVDWYPWGPEALGRAKAEGRPIFLSVGYSSCFWCHVMERECFRDEAIAKVLNENFVCIKVDREERPDIDQIYMTALQAFGNGGGWPMSMFLTPDGRPFFGGTYFPPRDQDGREGFPSLLQRVIAAWRDHRPELEADAEKLAEIVRRRNSRGAALRRVALGRNLAQAGITELGEQFDPQFGGFGYDPEVARRPKFPEPSNMVFLLEEHRRHREPLGGERSPLAMVTTTLDQLSRGGIRDHLAGGYHRYSTDRLWRVPHFEKMLYDNAQLATVYLAAYEVTQDPRWRREAEAIFAYVARTLTSHEGGFYSAQDAETEGEEGQYYVWTREEVKKVLGDGEDYSLIARAYGLDGEPNFEEKQYVLFLPRSLGLLAKDLKREEPALRERLEPLREKLLAARDRRPAPLRDDKILTSWNGLMIGAYADGFRILKNPAYQQAAEKAASFLWGNLRDSKGHLLRTYRSGQAKIGAYLEDYAFLASGLLRLHAATEDARWLAKARELSDQMIAGFADAKDGGFFYTSEDQESLLARPKDPYDNALPSGNSVAIRNLVVLAAATGEKSYLEQARQALDAFSPVLADTPAGAPLMLVALEDYLDVASAGNGDGKAPSAVARAPSVVSAEAQALAKGKIVPGSKFNVTVRVSIADGWHIASNAPGSQFVKPTRLDLAAGSSLTLPRVDYPPGERKTLVADVEPIIVYEGKVVLKAHLRVNPQAKPGPMSVTLKLLYQACNDRSCLMPAAIELPLEITVAERE